MASGFAAAGSAAKPVLPKGGGSQRVDKVQVDGLCLMKILKHARENPYDGASGPLLGLVVNHVLEITNCFPFPSRGDDGDNGDKFQIEMLRCLREVNVDHLQVGWYTSTFLGTYMDESLIANQYGFQNEIEESVALIYDPVRTAQGSLSLRAFRLTEEFMEMHKGGSFTRESFKEHAIRNDNIFEEVPVVVHSSNMSRIMLNELSGSLGDDFDRLDLSTSSYLEKNVRHLMGCVDELSAEAQKFNQHQKEVVRRQQQQAQFLQKRKLENQQREQSGEAPIEDDDLSGHPLFKPLPEPSQLETVLITGRLNHCSTQISEFSSSNLGKLFLAESLQED